MFYFSRDKALLISKTLLEKHKKLRKKYFFQTFKLSADNLPKTYQNYKAYTLMTPSHISILVFNES